MEVRMPKIIAQNGAELMFATNEGKELLITFIREKTAAKGGVFTGEERIQHTFVLNHFDILELKDMLKEIWK